MKITAEGYSRNVAGTHTITDKALAETAVSPSVDGVSIYIGKSNRLALSGNFSLRVHLSLAELAALSHVATVIKLERRIQELEAKVAQLSG